MRKSAPPKPSEQRDPEIERDAAPGQARSAAHRMLRGGDPLASGMAALAAHHGRRVTPEGLKAGIALDNGRLPIEHVEVAAEQAGLSAHWDTLDLSRIAAHDLPLLVESSDGAFEILWQIDDEGLTSDAASGRGSQGRRMGRAVVSPAGTPELKLTVPFADLAGVATGRVLRLRVPETRDSRADDAMARRKSNWFFSAFSESWPIYSQAIAATFAINMLALAIPLFSMNVYDRVIPNAAEESLWALAIGVAIAIAFDFLIRTLRGVFVDAASRRADVRLATKIYGRLIGARIEKQQTSVGVNANTMREFETLREFFTSATLTAFGDLPFLILFVAVIYVVAGNLAFVVAAAIPVILAVGWLTQRALANVMQDAFRQTAQKNAVVVETLYGMDALKAAGAEGWAAQKWEQAVAEHVRTGLKMRHVSNLGMHVIHGCQTTVQVLVVVVGYYQVASGAITMGALIAATILSGRALAPLAQAATLLTRLNQARMAYGALAAIVERPQERAPNRTLLDRIEVKGAIAFDRVTFQYADGAPPALNEVSFKIQAGEHVALLGPIGSGKSTALRLIQSHYQPDAGRVLIDDVPAGQIDPATLRRQVGLLLQGADLFHGTIRENIALGNPAAADADILVAARVAGALDWIVRLPQGFDTLVRERGAGLSGGQRQSVALARTLLAGPSVLLLDEPTSDMDNSTERNVIRRLKEHAAGRTVIVVTHRPAVLEMADRVIVINNGRKAHDGLRARVLDDLQGRAPGSGLGAGLGPDLGPDLGAGLGAAGPSIPDDVAASQLKTSQGAA